MFFNTFVFFVCFQQWPGSTIPKIERDTKRGFRCFQVSAALHALSPLPIVSSYLSFSLSHTLCSLQKTQSCSHVSAAAPRASKLSSCQSNFPSPPESGVKYVSVMEEGGDVGRVVGVKCEHA